jgi:hypothetical protein
MIKIFQALSFEGKSLFKVLDVALQRQLIPNMVCACCNPIENCR